MGIEWIKKIPWMKVLLSSVIYTLIAFLVRQIEAILTVKYYMMPEYFGVWSKLMMPTLGPPPSEFMITSLVVTFATGVSLAVIYCYLREFLPKDDKKRIFIFADLMVGASIVFFTLPVYLLFNVPFQLMLSWLITSFIIILAGSFVFVRIIK